jgi:DNA helicase-2/ATP-dependent DNA helicase PcrA
MSLLESLNPQQRQAVTSPPGPVLVLAGPGSGKTRVLTYRIGYLINHFGFRPGEIVAVTFTNKAAREMRSRVESLLNSEMAGSNRLRGMSLGTFHAFAARMIRREADSTPFNRDFVIFDDSDQLSLTKKILKDMNIDPKQISPNKVLDAISTAKNELISPEVFVAGNYFQEVVLRVYQQYQKELRRNNALDFDDLLFLAVQLLREKEGLRQSYQNHYQHILVDEFQDTNTAQYRLIRLLTGKDPDLFVVGDPDQSIYRWRGADYRNVLRFQEDFPQAKTILLEQNYRSTQNILDAAMAVIDKNQNRQPKELFTQRGAGSRVTIHEAYDEVDEANYVIEQIALLTFNGGVEPGDCAVMYRTNAQSRLLEESLLKAGLPYRLVGAQHFYGRREVKDVIAYLRLIHNPDDQVSLLRTINTPSRGLGDKTIATLLQVSEAEGIGSGRALLGIAEGTRTDLLSNFSGRAASALVAFGEMLSGWRSVAAEVDLGLLIDQVLRESGYEPYIDDGTDEGDDRWANVLELRAVAQEFSELGMTTFLEHVALISDQDTLTDEQNAPTLLTLHAAKGLEFPVVFIIGLDDGIIPHQRSFDDPEAMAEERRLFYVGITRAMDQLHLVRAFRRRLFGTSSVSESSRYLYDLPSDVLEGDLVGFETKEEVAYRRKTSWAWQSQTEELEPTFRVGMRVHHPKFGEGIVMESRVDHDEEEVTIAFESVGIKRLVGSMANLEILKEGESSSLGNAPFL